jgi:glucokinase
MTIDFHGPQCPCGKRGCIETLVSGPNIARGAQARLTPTSRIVQLAGSLEQVRSEHVGQAFREGDAMATEALTETAHLLTVWLGNIVDLLEPDVIVVGGGVAELMRSIFDSISKSLPHWSINQRAGALCRPAARLGVD